MDMDLKRSLIKQLNDIAPEYGLVELSYPSFMRCYGYKSQPLSAADAVEGISALLDVAGGVRMEVEVEGARNGGEWFGGGRMWEASSGSKEDMRGMRGEQRETVPPGEAGNKIGEGEEGEGVETKVEVQWWVKNFWTAFDALGK